MKVLKEILPTIPLKLLKKKSLKNIQSRELITCLFRPKVALGSKYYEREVTFFHAACSSKLHGDSVVCYLKA